MRTDMLTQDARAASFRPKARRRSSVAGNSKRAAPQLKWPHPDLDPVTLAHAGFFYNPSEDSPDNVCCYLCQKSLDGWEEGDNPAAEHYRHAPDCGWAVAVAIEHGLVDPHHDPHSEEAATGRFMTFGTDVWQHEGQGKGNLNIQCMVDAGFYFYPGKDAPDNAWCPYCATELDSWEADDNPWAEHQRRGASCEFFKSHGRKGRRNSRASVQSSNVSELGDTTDQEAPTTKRGRRASSVKSTASKKGGRKTKRESSVDPDTSMDAPKRGRKRASSVINKEPTIMFDGTKDTDDESTAIVVEQPKKRRTRASTAQTFDILDYEASAESVGTGAKKTTKGRNATTAKTTSRKAASRNMDDDDGDGPIDIGAVDKSFEEDPSAYQKPFVKQALRTTRSRTSILVEQQMREASEDVLIPAAKRGRSKTPSHAPQADWPSSARKGSVARQTSPIKPSPMKRNFFKEDDQDFNIPVRIPSHLSQPPSPGFDDSHTADEGSDEEPEKLPSPPPPPKPTRGRPKKTKAEPEEVKPSRAKAGQKSRAGAKSVEPTDEGVTEPEPPANSNPTPEPPNKELLEAKPAESEAVDRKRGVRTSGASTTTSVVAALDSITLTSETVHDDSMRTIDDSQAEFGDDEDGEPSSEAPRHDSPDMETENVDPVVHSSPGTARKHGVAFGEDVEDTNTTTDYVDALGSPAYEDDIHVPTSFTPPSKRARITTTAPWTTADLEAVFAMPDGTATSSVTLTDQEKEMTVEEWIKWNAANAEKRYCELAESKVKMFEEHGKRAIAAVEGIITH